MNTWWTRTIILGVALLAGCEGAIGGQGTSSGAGASTGAGSNTGAGNTVSTGAGNTVGTGAGGSTPVDPTVCTPGVPTTSQIPRLTRAEYDKTTRDLLGLDVQPSSMLAPDTLGSVDQRAWDGYKTAAASLATQVLATATAKAKVLPCTTDNATCIQQFITTFGQKAFRRPLTPAEVTRFQNLYTNRATLTAERDVRSGRHRDHQGVPDVAVVPQQDGDVDGRGRRVDVPGQQLGDGLAPLLHAVGHDAGRHAVHGGRAEQAARRRRTSWRRRSGCCRTRGRARRWPSSTSSTRCRARRRAGRRRRTIRRCSRSSRARWCRC